MVWLYLRRSLANSQMRVSNSHGPHYRPRQMRALVLTTPTKKTSCSNNYIWVAVRSYKYTYGLVMITTTLDLQLAFYLDHQSPDSFATRTGFVVSVGFLPDTKRSLCKIGDGILLKSLPWPPSFWLYCVYHSTHATYVRTPSTFLFRRL